MTEHDKPSADDRKAIKRPCMITQHSVSADDLEAAALDVFQSRLGNCTVREEALAQRGFQSGYGAARRDADRRVEEARARVAILGTVARAADRLSDCLAEFGDQPGCCGEKLDELGEALVVWRAMHDAATGATASESRELSYAVTDAMILAGIAAMREISWDLEPDIPAMRAALIAALAAA